MLQDRNGRTGTDETLAPEGNNLTDAEKFMANFYAMMRQSPIVAWLQTQGRRKRKGSTSDLHPKRTGRVRFRLGQDQYGTLSVVFRGSGEIRLHRAGDEGELPGRKKPIDLTRKTEDLVYLAKNGQVAWVLLGGGEVKINRTDLLSFLVAAGAMKAPPKPGP